MFLSEEELRKIAAEAAKESQEKVLDNLRQAIREETSSWHHISAEDHYEHHKFVAFLLKMFNKARDGLIGMVLILVIMAIIGFAIIAMGSEVGQKILLKVFK